MSSISSLGDGASGGFDLNSAAMESGHQESSPLAGLINLDSDREYEETLALSPESPIGSGENASAGMELKGRLGLRQKSEVDAATAAVSRGDSGGVKSRVIEICNGAEPVDHGVIFSEEKLSMGDGRPNQSELRLEFTSEMEDVCLGMNWSTNGNSIRGGNKPPIAKSIHNGANFSRKIASTSDCVTGPISHVMVDGEADPNQSEVAVEFTLETKDVCLGMNQSSFANAMGGGDEALIAKFNSELTILCSKQDGKIQVLGDAVGNARNTGEQEPSEGMEKGTIHPVTIWSKKSSLKNDQHARDYFPPRDRDGAFFVSDIVWGKVKSHPWWPGEIFDPSDASEMALKHQEDGKLLIAYFGDKTFAWNNESQLKPFDKHFSRMEKQSNLDSFADAVNAALAELSRRIELGMACSCIADESYADMKYQNIENAGIREGTQKSPVDIHLIVISFQPERFLQNIEGFAQLPHGPADRLELVIAKAQLKAFYRYRLKGNAELPVFIDGGMLAENDFEASTSKRKEFGIDNVDYPTLVPSDPNSGDQKLSGQLSTSRKHIKQKRLSKLMSGKGASRLANGRSGSIGKKKSCSAKKRKAADSDSTDSGKCKKSRFGLTEDLESRTPPRSDNVGGHHHRVLDQSIGSPSIHKSNDEKKHAAKRNRERDDFAVNDKAHIHAENSRNDAIEICSFPNEMLSQLCLTARDPMVGHSFTPMMISYFTLFRLSTPSSSPIDIELVETGGGKRDQIKLATSTSEPMKMATPDNLNDSYWPDIIFQNSPVEDLAGSELTREGKSQLKKRKKKMKLACEEPSRPLPLDATSGSAHYILGGLDSSTKQESAEQRPGSDSGERIVMESSPTSLILNFTVSSALPSKTKLIHIFSQYGPLEEADTVVSKKRKRAKVVFKKRNDAERAYSSSGKYSTFGPALISYRLRYLTSTFKASPSAT